MTTHPRRPGEKFKYQLVLLDPHMRPIGRIDFTAASMDDAAKRYLREAKKYILGGGIGYPSVYGMFLQRIRD